MSTNAPSTSSKAASTSTNDPSTTDVVPKNPIVVGKGQEASLERMGEGDGDIEMLDATGLSHNDLDLRAQRAILSFNRINLRDPPLELRFGNWNTRPLVEKHARSLLEAMRSQNIKPFQQGTMIPLIMSSTEIESTCLHKDLATVAESPFLKLTSAGKAKGCLVAAGGRHRFHAIKLATEELEAQIIKLQDELEGLEGPSNNDDGKEDREKRVEEMRAGIVAREAKLAMTATWGVIIYDAGPMLENGAELALHVSRNQPIVHFAEDEKEGILMCVKMFRNKMTTLGLDSPAMKQWLRKIGLDQRGVVGQIMNHRETQQYLLNLDDFQPHFNYTNVFSVTWVKSNMHSVSGGVISTLVEYMCSLWRAMFSGSAMDETMPWKEYCEKVREGEEEDDEELRLASKISWGSMLDPGVVGTRQPQLSMLTPGMMAALVEVTSEVDIFELLIGGESNLWQGYVKGVMSVFSGEILSKSFNDEAERRVRSTFKKKVDFVLFDQQDYHFQRPLPFLTPTILDGLGKVLHGIREAQAEFWRWFDPMGQYFCNALKNSEEAKDQSAWALRMISADVDDLFERPQEAARDLAHFVVKHLDAFIQFEADIDLFTDYPTRPLGPDSQTKITLEREYPGLKKWVADKVKVMKAAKTDHTVMVNNWVLEHRSHYDWRRKTIQNTNRDFERFARLAYAEEQITDMYRKKLLRTSKAGAFLRHQAYLLLSSHSKVKSSLNRKQLSLLQEKEYIYPDRLQQTHVEKPSVNIQAIVSSQEHDKQWKLYRQGVESTIRKLENAPFCVAKPGSSLLAPAVAEKIEELKDVLLRNAEVLVLMQDLPDIKLVDPLDEKWGEVDYKDLDYKAKRTWEIDCPEAEEVEALKEELAANLKEQREAKAKEELQAKSKKVAGKLTKPTKEGPVKAPKVTPSQLKAAKARAQAKAKAKKAATPSSNSSEEEVPLKELKEKHIATSSFTPLPPAPPALPSPSAAPSPGAAPSAAAARPPSATPPPAAAPTSAVPPLVAAEPIPSTPVSPACEPVPDVGKMTLGPAASIIPAPRGNRGARGSLRGRLGAKGKQRAAPSIGATAIKVPPTAQFPPAATATLGLPPRPSPLQTLSQLSTIAEPSSSFPPNPNPAKRTVTQANLSPESPRHKTRQHTRILRDPSHQAPLDDDITQFNDEEMNVDPVDDPMDEDEELEEAPTQARQFPSGRR